MKTLKEPAGIWKLEVICLFMVLAWSKKNELWLTPTDTMILVDQRGITLMMAFSSSTCSIVQRLHVFEGDPSDAIACSLSLMMQALFRNLKHKVSLEVSYYGCYSHTWNPHLC